MNGPVNVSFLLSISVMRTKHQQTTSVHRPNKTFGQHFLKSEAILQAIIATADIQLIDCVLEVGPGKGVLTSALLQKAQCVVAVEKDRLLIPYLAERFVREIAQKKLVLVEGDILKLSPQELGIPKKYKVVANIPYYITGHFLRQFLSSKHQPTTMTLLVQKEVAERIVARDGKESVLSLSVKAYGTPKIIRTVPAGCFSPPPKVASAILHIGAISRNFFNSPKEERVFFELIKKAFNQKRKLVSAVLKDSISPIQIEKVLGKVAGRPEALFLHKWLLLVKLLQNQQSRK